MAFWSARENPLIHGGGARKQEGKERSDGNRQAFILFPVENDDDIEGPRGRERGKDGVSRKVHADWGGDTDRGVFRWKRMLVPTLVVGTYRLSTIWGRRAQDKKMIKRSLSRNFSPRHDIFSGTLSVGRVFKLSQLCHHGLSRSPLAVLECSYCIDFCHFDGVYPTTFAPCCPDTSSKNR